MANTWSHDVFLGGNLDNPQKVTPEWYSKTHGVYLFRFFYIMVSIDIACFNEE